LGESLKILLNATKKAKYLMVKGKWMKLKLQKCVCCNYAVKLTSAGGDILATPHLDPD
jgi:hypothetical protein